ncbi:LanC-like protein gcl1 [Stylosanthes scabra]|uniref:LanC-like protein gcl1 n=1 Tax=Stylosanthes scabra TaxID=79078 RepID=A0ABU6THK8_9FABA|nr:LanC-like protein gcl1 [Stylosanthes scabra]
MTSWVFEENGGHDEGKHQPSDLIITENTNLTATNLSSLPTETFLRAAVTLKDQVVEETWKKREEMVDPTVYKGLLGTAFTCLRSYEVTGNHGDLRLCSQIVDTCATVARDSLRHVTFLCGRGGAYALGAVVANYMGDLPKRHLFLGLFIEVTFATLKHLVASSMLAKERALPVGAEEGGFGMSYDLLYGRAGFLWAALFINKYLGEEAVPREILMAIMDAVLAGGRAGASDIKDCPLMYRWHGTRYLGAANGLAGILHVLLHFPLPSEDAEDVKGTLRYLMSKRFPHSGNYPSSEGNPRDKLVQWGHGAAGMAITFSKAAEVFPNDRELRDAAIEAGEVVWKSGLVKKVGLTDGVAGNAYSFLSLLRLTKEPIYEDRAKAFSCFLYQNATSLIANGDDGGNAYSLFHGLAGTACLWFDLLAPHNSRFPGYEL